MQNIVNKLQEIIKAHYGYLCELELKPVTSYQSLHRQAYSPVDRCLTVPLIEPQSGQPIAFFKIFDVPENRPQDHERLQDLVSVTLQSYLELIDRMELSESLMQYLQIELQPEKIIRLHEKLSEKKEALSLQNPPKVAHTDDTHFRNRELLIMSSSLLALDRLVLAIHETSRNPFFIRFDHMPENFLNSLNDLTGLNNTTLYIPRIQKLTAVQQKTLETYFLMPNYRESSVLIICGTRSPVSKMVAQEQISPRLLHHLHFFHVLAQSEKDAPVRFETLSQCALSILGVANGKDGEKSAAFQQKTKSYNIIPSLNDLFPTIH